MALSTLQFLPTHLREAECKDADDEEVGTGGKVGHLLHPGGPGDDEVEGLEGHHHQGGDHQVVIVPRLQQHTAHCSADWKIKRQLWESGGYICYPWWEFSL